MKLSAPVIVRINFLDASITLDNNLNRLRICTVRDNPAVRRIKSLLAVCLISNRVRKDNYLSALIRLKVTRSPKLFLHVVRISPSLDRKHLRCELIEAVDCNCTVSLSNTDKSIESNLIESSLSNYVVSRKLRYSSFKRSLDLESDEIIHTLKYDVKHFVPVYTTVKEFLETDLNSSTDSRCRNFEALTSSHLPYFVTTSKTYSCYELLSSKAVVNLSTEERLVALTYNLNLSKV